MYQLTGLGELLIDFTESGISPSGMKLFERNAGGAVANVIAAAAKLGCSTAFIGKVGDDMHGAFLKDTLKNVGVDTKGIIIDNNFFTTLAFVAFISGYERTFSFARKPGADTRLKISEIDKEIIKSSAIFHVGSLSLTDEPSRETTFHAVRYARKHGAVISFDPNYRASLWKSRDLAKQMFKRMIPYVDIIKISDEEAEIITGETDSKKAIEALRNDGIPCVILTLGKYGALVSCREQTGISKSYPILPLDTTGAGDAFLGGFLYKMLQLNKKPNKLNFDEALICADWANAVAACAIQKRGAISAMPTVNETLDFIRKHNRS